MPGRGGKEDRGSMMMMAPTGITVDGCVGWGLAAF